MKSDFSRLSFNPAKHFSRVLQQQGRVTLDADGNEQTAILLHYLQTLARDLIGPHAGAGDGFVLRNTRGNDNLADISIGSGNYYVDGILVENHASQDNPVTYKTQPDYPLPEDDVLVASQHTPLTGEVVWLYLDVWERHISPIDDDSIREVALAGIDTCHRAKVVWQIKSMLLPIAPVSLGQMLSRQAQLQERKRELETALRHLQATRLLRDPVITGAANRAALSADANRDAAGAPAAAAPAAAPAPGATTAPIPADTSTPVTGNTAGIVADEGLEAILSSLQSALDSAEKELADLDEQLPCSVGMNSLQRSNALLAAKIDQGKSDPNPCVISPRAKYRGQENHLYRVEIHQGGKADGTSTGASFKWSRENGSVATRWLASQTDTDSQSYTLQVASSRGFAAGDWVELLWEALELTGQPGNLVKLAKVEPGILTVDASTDSAKLTRPILARGAKVRRWDQTDNDQQRLVDGAVVIRESDTRFIDLEDGIQIRFALGGEYRSGDYWLITARVGVDQIENWPMQSDEPLALSPYGIEHHYAPLGVAHLNSDGNFEDDLLQLCDCRIEPQARCGRVE